ncbi:MULTISPECIES: hypothetical protein [Streptomyces violaceusniger group]|uniref:Gram-positive cocci surface proteins LPxTG domain-containing protein n=3 Tax=Streptomyces violaceusniger group TaxID=2839105 RepID=A0ABN1PEP2_9ACTN|nr:MULTISPECIES: hypothetical protein [Streptomyces violaceusniger group]MBI0318948.1 hypothetical protein [Streptomyces javensis]
MSAPITSRACVAAAIATASLALTTALAQSAYAGTSSSSIVKSRTEASSLVAPTPEPEDSRSTTGREPAGDDTTKTTRRTEREDSGKREPAGDDTTTTTRRPSGGVKTGTGSGASEPNSLETALGAALAAAGLGGGVLIVRRRRAAADRD